MARKESKPKRKRAKAKATAKKSPFACPKCGSNAAVTLAESGYDRYWTLQEAPDGEIKAVSRCDPFSDEGFHEFELSCSTCNYAWACPDKLFDKIGFDE